MRQRLTLLLTCSMRTRRRAIRRISRFLRPCELPAPGFLHGHDDLDLVERERQEAEILQQPAACGQGIGRSVCNPLVVGAAPVSLTQEQDRKRGIDEQHVFHRVAFFLPL